MLECATVKDSRANGDARLLTRRNILLGGGIASLGLTGAATMLHSKIKNRLANMTQLSSFAATPPLVPHDPQRDRTTISVAQRGGPAENVDTVLSKLGGLARIVGASDVVIVKVSAQWWNQGMTNVAAVRRVLEHLVELPGFNGEIIVFENTHFRLSNGSGLSRAWTRPSDRNVDVAGWSTLGDLIPYFEKRHAPVSFVGLVDAGPSSLADDDWHDAGHQHGIYGGDGRGPIAAGDSRDGYHWDFSRTFRLQRSWVDDAKTPLTWPRFTSPRSGLVVDLKAGVLRREGSALVPVDRKLTWINLTTANEHGSTGFTGACKSTMGVVDMSAGSLGTHPLVRGYRSIHYFGRGNPSATWRMAGPLAQFAREVRAPDLILSVAEWVAFEPVTYDGAEDIRHSASTCMQAQAIVAGKDPVAIDAWLCRNVLSKVPSRHRAEYHDLANPDAMFTKFLRYYRQVYGGGAMDPSLIDVL